MGHCGWIPFFALAFTVAGTSSAADITDAVHRIGERDLLPQAQTALDALNASITADESFRAVVDPRTGFATSLRDGRLAPPPGPRDSGAAALAFFRAHGSVFGLDPRVELFVLPMGTVERRASLGLTFDGIRIDGAAARAVFDSTGDLTAAFLRAPAVAPSVAAHGLAEPDAIAAAIAAVSARRAGLGSSDPLATPRASQVYLPRDGTLLPAWRIDVAPVARDEVWVSFVDAGSGAVLSAYDRVQSAGKGNLPVDFDGTFITFQKFKLDDAKGRVYATESAAIAGASQKKTIKNFAVKGATGVISKGFVFGARSNVFDFFEQDPFEPSMVFDYDPFSTTPTSTGIPEFDAFDCVNVNYQLEIFYQHLIKNLGVGQLASNMSIPVIVNTPETEINAFFAPDVFPDAINPSTFGFMQFFDLTAGLSDPGDDVARDPVAACHEYGHAWLFYEGTPFADTQHFPPRAVGEAIPDFFATTFHGNTNIIGAYVAAEMTGTPLRVLQDDDQFPETTLEWTFDADPGAPVALVSEEHGNGEIFGSLLLDVRDAIGGKKAEQLVFAALPDMPQTMADLGFSDGQVFADPVLPTAVYMGNCAFSMVQAANTKSELAAVMGAATGRGLFGGPASEFNVIMNLELLDDRVIVYPSTLPRPTSVHSYSFQGKQGRKLKITLTCSAGPLFADFTLGSSPGLAGDFTMTQSKVTSPDGKIVTLNGTTLNLPLNASSGASDPFYFITVDATAGTGTYTLKLDV